VKAAAAAVYEVEHAQEELVARRLEGAAEGRAGLERGSRMESLAAEQSAIQDRARAELLVRMGAERRVALEAAVEAHLASRVEARQVEGLLERVRVREKREAERRAQAESDDRFLSRRSWLGSED
jgi:hypothetical protein